MYAWHEFEQLFTTPDTDSNETGNFQICPVYYNNTKIEIDKSQLSNYSYNGRQLENVFAYFLAGFLIRQLFLDPSPAKMMFVEESLGSLDVSKLVNVPRYAHPFKVETPMAGLPSSELKSAVSDRVKSKIREEQELMEAMREQQEQAELDAMAMQMSSADFGSRSGGSSASASASLSKKPSSSDSILAEERRKQEQQKRIIEEQEMQAKKVRLTEIESSLKTTELELETLNNSKHELFVQLRQVMQQEEQRRQEAQRREEEKRWQEEIQRRLLTPSPSPLAAMSTSPSPLPFPPPELLAQGPTGLPFLFPPPTLLASLATPPSAPSPHASSAHLSNQDRSQDSAPLASPGERSHFNPSHSSHHHHRSQNHHQHTHQNHNQNSQGPQRRRNFDSSNDGPTSSQSYGGHSSGGNSGSSQRHSSSNSGAGNWHEGTGPSDRKRTYSQFNDFHKNAPSGSGHNSGSYTGSGGDMGSNSGQRQGNRYENQSDLPPRGGDSEHPHRGSGNNSGSANMNDHRGPNNEHSRDNRGHNNEGPGYRPDGYRERSNDHHRYQQRDSRDSFGGDQRDQRDQREPRDSRHPQNRGPRPSHYGGNNKS